MARSATTSARTATAAASPAEAEVVALLSELLRIDTSNPGRPERPAAEWTAARLGEAGIDSRIVESAPGRASVIARVAGADRTPSQPGDSDKGQRRGNARGMGAEPPHGSFLFKVATDASVGGRRSAGRVR